MIDIRVETAPFDPGVEIARLSRLGGGGIASFVGIVRGDDGLTELMLEHHPRLTPAMLRALADEAVKRWDLLGVVLIHRHGSLRPGEGIVFVGIAAMHRAAALEACAALIDRLKTDAPFWKRESFANGHSRWVEPRPEDAAAAARWLQDDGRSDRALPHF